MKIILLRNRSYFFLNLLSPFKCWRPLASNFLVVNPFTTFLGTLDLDYEVDIFQNMLFSPPFFWSLFNYLLVYFS